MLDFGDFVSVALTLCCRFVVIALCVSCCLGLLVGGFGWFVELFAFKCVDGACCLISLVWVWCGLFGCDYCLCSCCLDLFVVC